MKKFISTRRLLSGVMVCVATALSVTGCTSQNIADYQNTTPTLNMLQFFSGDIVGYGMFQGRDGKVQKRFEVLIKTKYENGVLVLDEDFSWSDGSKTKRVWRLTQKPNGEWRGTAGDVIGEATGKVAGNALHWQYVLALPVDGKVYHVNFDDWMYLINKDVMLNRSVMSKFGVNLGSVTLSLQRMAH